MDSLQAIATAKKYIGEVYADEELVDIDLDEIEHVPASGMWNVTLILSRPWDTPRTRAQELLENMGAASPFRRSIKTVTLDENGNVLAMKNRKLDLPG